jgi:hypothetical protein
MGTLPARLANACTDAHDDFLHCGKFSSLRKQTIAGDVSRAKDVQEVLSAEVSSFDGLSRAGNVKIFRKSALPLRRQSRIIPCVDTGQWNGGLATRLRVLDIAQTPLRPAMNTVSERTDALPSKNPFLDETTESSDTRPYKSSFFRGRKHA